jgi:hypothetical protein
MSNKINKKEIGKIVEIDYSELISREPWEVYCFRIVMEDIEI